MIKRIAAGLFTAALVVLLSPSVALAQATSSISGTVVDSAGGAIPGVAVVVTSEGGQTFETVTNAEGIFNIPSIAPGAYKVAVSLAGFKTAVTNVRAAPGTPLTVKMTLEVGAITETVNVRSSSELINTQTATIASTLNSDQLNRMPTPTRNALNAVTFLPGINTLGANRDSTINGLPESMVQITMDGVSNNDNFLRSSDSFFASVTPRQDAVEAVSVVTAVGGANVGGSGAVSINFTTRSGGNRFAGTAYEYWRHPSMNTNYYFNELNGLEKNDIKLNQYGARVSGPVVIPGLYDGRGRAFYMLHYEQLRFPNSFTRTRNVLNPRALDGWFRYEAGGQTREVNVLSLGDPGRPGGAAQVDPTVISLLNKINASMATTGTIQTTTDPMLNRFVYLSPGKLFEHQPTMRVDYNITDNHRFSGSYAVIWAERDPDYLNGVDARFPGAPNYRFFHSKRPLGTATLRSTLSKDIVNELKFGITAKGGASYFGDMSSNGPQTFADQDGYAVDFPNFDDNNSLTNWFATNGPSWRSVPTYEITNSMTWQKNTHSLMFGGTWLLSQGWENAQQMVPGISLGFDTQRDPAAGLFTTSNFPSASGGQLTDARDLYALLTGRVTSVTSQIALDENTNKYVQLGPRTRAGGITMLSGFLQDTWRWTPTVTFTGGLRYDVQLPFTPTNDIMSRVEMADFCGPSGLGDGGTYSKCNFLTPGASGGVVPEFKQLTSGTNGYKTDWNNLGPTIGLAWRPNVQDGWLRTLLGDPEQATVRGGYSVSYERQGLGVFTGIYGSNPGSIINTTRSATSAEPIVPAGQPWPVYFNQKERLYLPGFSPDPTYPIPIQQNRGSDLNGFAPDVKIGSAQTWTVSFQRSITRDMAIEARYVGTRGRDQWSELDYNGIRGENIVANRFLDEFRLAQQNLKANNAAGRTGSFAYFGPGTGTNPLPIYLAYFSGRTDAGNAGAYTATAWTDTGFAGRLVSTNASPLGAAGDLDGNTGRRNNAITAGLPANFFVVNPLVDENNVTDSGAFSDYHALQLELRRRLSRGLQVNVNYQYAIEGGSAFDGFSFGRTMVTTTGGAPLHAIKSQWDWTVPVGRGQRYGANMNAILDGILGGWSMNAVSRTQQRLVNFGNVKLVGMSKDDLQDMYKFETRVINAAGARAVFMLPDDVILNTRRAFSISSSTLTGYSASLGAPEGRYIAPANSDGCIQIRAGDCAPRELVLKAPWFSRVDFGITKKFPLGGTKNVEVRFDILNLFDNINFNPVANPGTGATIFQTTSAYTDASNTYDPGGRLGQLMFRFNW